MHRTHFVDHFQVVKLNLSYKKKTSPTMLLGLVVTYLDMVSHASLSQVFREEAHKALPKTDSIKSLKLQKL